jgi:hypothetical protein
VHVADDLQQPPLSSPRLLEDAEAVRDSY